MDEVAERIRSLAESACARSGVELIDAAVKRGRTSLVRLTIDSDTEVDLDTCAEVSSRLSRMLDADDPLPEHYTLEVTTPGADRPLTAPRDFRRNVGRVLTIRTTDGSAEGECIASDEDTVTIRTDKGEQTIPLASIDDARVVLPW